MKKDKKEKSEKRGKNNELSINSTGSKKMSKFREKLDMYDMILANLIAGTSIIEPSEKLTNAQIAIGFSSIASESQLTKYFIITGFPDYLPSALMDRIRMRCIMPGVKINFYFHANPYKINWESAEMKSKMQVWKRYSEEHSGEIDVFSYRSQHGDAQMRNRIIQSTKYLNVADLEYKRSLLRVMFVIEVSGQRTDDGLANLAESVKLLKEMCSQSDIKLRELRINMLDWLRAIGPFSLTPSKDTAGKLSRKILTDDILANFNSYRQGRVGSKGQLLGVDILSNGPVLRMFKEDPDGADNWLVSANTGGGKSFFVKSLLTYLLADNFTVVVMDYEGDEYDPLANYIKAGNPSDVKIVSMGKSNTVYFDPCEIPPLTGDPEVDNDLKSNAINFITAIFKTMVHGLEGEFTRSESKVLSLAIQRMYDSAGVTEDKSTWERSRNLRLSHVYEEVKNIVESKELMDGSDDNEKHRAAIKICDATSLHFEPGEMYYNYWRNPMSAEELYKAKLIIFSFGMKGADQSSVDSILLALKQLSVAYVNIMISNYCKYVKHGFNVKVWEEFQRWGAIKSSTTILANTITGGRKRGDVNFIITNDLGAILDENNRLSSILLDNIQNFAIGSIPDEKVRRKLCESRGLQSCKIALDRIAKATVTESGKAKRKFASGQNRYKYAFCIAMDSGKKVIVKAMLPEALVKTSLFRTGVDVKE